MRGKWLKNNIAPIALIFLIAVTFLYGVLQIKPLDADNLIALSFGKIRLRDMFRRSYVSYFPAYRPLVQVTIWLHYKFLDTNFIPLHYAVNLLIWILCVICFYYLVRSLTKSSIGSLLASLLLLVDNRIISALTLIGERQNTMSIFFGLLAILILIRNKNKKIGIRNLFFIYLLLLFSLLSKEYGIIFSIMVFFFALKTKVRNIRSVLVVAFLAITTYFIMRYGLVKNIPSITTYCEGMGFYTEIKTVCYSKLSAQASTDQKIYNIMASFLGTVFPIFLTHHGALEYSLDFTPQIFFYFFSFFIAMLAVLKRSRKTLVFLLLLVVNAFVSFLIYRTRNQLIGMIAYYSIIAMGIDYLYNVLKIRYFTLIVIIYFIYYRGLVLRQDINNWTKSLSRIHPIHEYERYQKDIDLEIAEKIQKYYKLGKPRY